MFQTLEPARGYSLLELTLVVALAATIGALSVPIVGGTIDDLRVR